MKAKRLYYLLFSFLFFSWPGTLLSQANSIFHVLCYEKLAPWIERIMVGCEAWDCCTGCPKSPIELRFRFAAEPGVALVLRLENADKDLKQQLKLEGNIRWLNDNELELKAGVARIMGFPPDNNVLISPRYSITEKQLYTKEKAVKLRSSLPKSFMIDTASLSVKKYLSGYLLDEQQYMTRFYWCKRPIPPKRKSYEDRIQQINNTGDNSVIVADGKKWLIGCEDDEIYFPVTGTVSVGNFMNSGECNAETFVFSKDNAMAAAVPSTEWDFRSGNLQTIQLSPMIEVPVVIWLVPSILRDRVVTEVDRANFLLNYNRSGIILVPDYRVIPAGSAELSFIEPMRCENANQIASSIFYVPGKINVYYTEIVLDDLATSTTGRCCFNNNHREIMGVSRTGLIETLAHEIGHSFSLDHTNDVPEMGQENIMYGGGMFRYIFTEGQDFRININDNSTVNSLGFRVGPTRFCSDNVSSNICVPLSLDRPN